MVDVHFDFTLDCAGYWDGYWERDPLFGGTTVDPDSSSKTMQRYHQLIYSKPLPNGEIMDLKIGMGPQYLTWKNFRFGSDSITASFRYKKYRSMIEKVASEVPDFHGFIEDFVHRTYTLGGEIIFPKNKGGINQSRGLNRLVRDRWDLTLECIRRYYLGQENPLSEVLNREAEFFGLFVDFKGYVDFFYLQDCVSPNYDRVNFWIGDGSLETDPLPKMVEEYLLWIDQQLVFVELRNNRIQEAVRGLSD